jgi:DNA-binding NtrC family response regulator
MLAIEEKQDAAVEPLTLKRLVSDYERSLIVDALQTTRGNQRRAAALLQVLPTTLHEKMKRLGLMGAARPEDEEAETWETGAEAQSS